MVTAGSEGLYPANGHQSPQPDASQAHLAARPTHPRCPFSPFELFTLPVISVHSLIYLKSIFPLYLLQTWREHRSSWLGVTGGCPRPSWCLLCTVTTARGTRRSCSPSTTRTTSRRPRGKAAKRVRTSPLRIAASAWLYARAILTLFLHVQPSRRWTETARATEPAAR